MRRDGTKKSAATILVVLLVSLIPLLFPGDAPWVNDEPNLIALAMKANDKGVMQAVGLPGNMGIRYGPLPAWIYQGLLKVSPGPERMVLLRAALVTAVTTASLLWLARTMGWQGWFAPVALLSPYLWFYSRLLWDNSFCIPLSVLLLAAYAAVLHRPTRWSWGLALLALLLLPLVHLMCAAMIIPFALHIAATQWRRLRQFPIVTIGVVGGVIFFAWPYLDYLLHAESKAVTMGTGLDGWWFALLGGRFLTAWGFDYFFDGDWTAAAGGAGQIVLRGLVWISMIGFALVWIGMVSATQEVVRAVRDPARRGPRAHLCGLALSVVATQTLLNGIAHAYGHPHYYNATWSVFLFLAWLGSERLGRWQPAATALHGVAMGCVLAFFIARIHSTGGTRGDHYGPVLTEQVKVARTLAPYAPNGDLYRVRGEHFDKFPHALYGLRSFPALRPRKNAPRRDVIIRYSSKDPAIARMEVLDYDTRQIISAP